jgi:tripartite-type tricarboxylate transporter receptor subunit TctC
LLVNSFETACALIDAATGASLEITTGGALAMAIAPRVAMIGGLTLTALVLSGPARADDWPTRPVTMVVPFAAGSASDTVGRVMAAALSEALGQQVIVENIAGAAGMTGTARVSRAAPDGYQLVLASVDSMAIAPAMHKQPPYNPLTDFTPIGLVVDQPIILVTRKDLPIHTLQEFVSYTKENAPKMQFASSGVGGGSHFACARLNAAIGVEPIHVPYRGSAAALQDLIAGRIDYLCAPGAGAIGPIEGGTVNAIAQLTSERSPLFPDLKTAREQGVSGAESYFWTGLFFPKGAPAGIVGKLDEAIDKVLNNPQVIERLQKSGATPIPAGHRSSDYLETLMVSETEAWNKAVKASGVPIE